MGTISFSLSVILLISVLWEPALADKCSLACKGSPAGPTFQAGQTYNYGVEGSVTIFLSGADNQETGVKLLGQVSVTALDNCNYQLDVQKLSVSGPDGKKYESPPGIKKPVKFGYQDGKIQPQICAEEDDTRQSLNIKRAIISLLQNEQKPSTQVDVFGICPTEVSTSHEGGAVIVHRSRDLSRCSHREQGKSDIIISNVNPNAGVKDMQVLQSTLNVESKVINGVPEKVAATEEYLYKPFSIGENGARAKVHTKLTLTGKGKAVAPSSKCTDVNSIIFENPHNGEKVPKNDHACLGAVKEVAKSVTNNVGANSASSFAQLVRILRRTEKEDLVKVFNQVKGNTLEKRVFLDALLRAGTGDSIEASILILKTRQLSQLEQQLVFLSLGNARHVNNDALKAAAGLLDLPNLPKDVYLGAGALAGAYCREHECHSSKADGVVAISQKFGSKLHCKPKTKTEEDTVVAVLKGIRNIRHLENSLIEKLVRCVNDNNVKPRIRAAVLEAFHADPCSPKVKKISLDILKNRQLDSEIRIKAYLAVIECPCGHSANEIKNLLDNEPVHQVGNFISSSLRHIRSSANPDKRLAREHYGLIRTPKKFNSDDRKYSFYREMSYNIDALGAGGSVDETVIYSQDSYLPRSVNFNLTVSLFGHDFNVLEFGGRQGNLDRVLEHFLGPKSFLRTESPQAIYDSLVKRFEEAKKKVEDGLTRGRRSVKTEIDSFDKNLKAEAAPYNNELDLDIFVKLFGTDAVFLSFGDDKGFDFNKILDDILGTCSSGINKLKHFQTDFRTHLLFLDAELAYPTSTGLPLHLNLVGSATAKLDLATNIDVRQIIYSPQNAKIDVKFIPSTDLEIAGAFLVDAYAVTTGLKVSTTLRSSTGVHVIAKVLENGRGFDLQLALPVDKQELLVASNDLLYVTAERGQNEKYVPIKIGTAPKEYPACFDQLSSVLGLTLCTEFTTPFAISKDKRGPSDDSITQFLARFPLSGSAKVKVVLEKNDLRGYHIKGVVREDKGAGKRSFELLFDAEGSRNRRTQLTGEVVYNDHEVGLQIALDSPIKVLHAQISAYNKPNEMVALVKAKIDNLEYYAKAGFAVQGNAQRSIYKPILEYQLAEDGGKKHEIKVDGQMVKESNGQITRYSLEGVQINLPNTEEPLQITGHAANQPQTREFDFDVAVKNFASLKGGVKGTNVNLEFENKLNPVINFKLKGIFEFTDTIHNEIDLQYGPNFKDPNSRIFLSQLLKYHIKSAEDFNIITKNKFEIRAIPFKIVAEADIDPKKVIVEIGGQVEQRSAAFELEARTQIEKPGDYSVKIKGNIDKFCVEVLAKRNILNADKSNLENYVDIKGYGRYELSGVLLHKNKPNDVNLGAIGHLKISSSGKSDDIKFDVGVVENTHFYSSHAVISNSKGTLLDYLLKISRGGTPSGQLKFVLKDTIAANGEYKVTGNDGKGNGVVIVDFKTLQRKFKADVSFLAKEPVFNANIDLYLDFDKNKNDKICFSTNTKKTDKLLESKNKLEYGGKNFELNIHLEGNFDLTGATRAKVEIVLPNERCLSYEVNRNIAVNNAGLYNGFAKVLISDEEKRGAAASTIKYEAKIRDTNIEKQIISYEGQLEFQFKNKGQSQDLKNTFSLRNFPDGDKLYNFDFKTDVRGNLIPKPASLVASVTYDSSMSMLDDKYRFKGNYGDDISFELAGVQEIKLTKGEKKFNDDFALTIRLPFEKAHDIKWVSTILFLQPEGKDFVEYTLIESVQINADVYKIDMNGKKSVNDGTGTLKFLVPHVDPFILDYKYKNGLEGEKKSNAFEVRAKYGKGKSAAITLDTAFSPHENYLQFKGQAPQAENLKKLEFTINSKNPSPDSYSSTLIVDADGRVYKLENNVVLSKAHPVLDLKYSSPSSNRPRKIYIKGTSLSSTQGKIEVNLQDINGICLDAVSEGNIQKDNIAIKFQGNSKELGMKNYIVEISSKDAGSGKRLEFHATNDNKNVLSGSTSFISKQEGQGTIIEGSGTVKVKEEQKSANFKYIRTVLTEGNEKGVETFLKLSLGERSYAAESRVTNLEYKNSYIYCEEKKQCAAIEIQSKIDLSKPGVIVNVVNAGFDLRTLGILPEIGFQMRDEVSDNRFPRFTLDLHVNTKEKKYHLNAYNTPDFGNYGSGVVFYLPSRVMALETKVTYPTSNDSPYIFTGEVCLDMDKKKQGHKTSARYLINFSNYRNVQESINAEIGFFHPRLDKEVVIKSNTVFKVPEVNRYILESSVSLCHSSLGADRVSKLLLDVSPTKFVFLAQTPFVKVIDLEGTVDVQSKAKTQQAKLRFKLLEGKEVSVQALAKDFQYFEFTTGYLEEADRKLSIVGHLVPEKRVDITADIILSGDKKNIAHGALFLQDNLVKSDYGLSKENFNYFLNALKNDLDTLAERIKEKSEKAGQEISTISQKTAPYFKKIDEDFRREWSKFYQEVTDDKTLKELSHAFNEIVQFFAKIFDTIYKGTEPIVDSIINTYVETVKKIAELYEKQLEPQVRQLYETLAALLKEYLDGLIDLVAHFAALITDFFEKHKPELQEFTNVITDIFKDLTRIIVAQVKELPSLIAQSYRNIVEQISALPILSNLKEKWNDLVVPEKILEVTQILYSNIQKLLPTQESRDLAEAIHSYVQKKLRNQKCDDEKELRVVYQKLITAVTSLVQFLRTQLNEFGIINTTPDFANFFAAPSSIKSAPSLAGEATWSFFKQLYSGDFPDILALLRAYRPRSINPLDEVPSKLRAVVVNGQHIFTFDGRHLTFPGNCRYVLAHDHVDRNFTLLIQLQNGKPKALILEDKSGAIIELKENGQAILNGASKGFPIIEKDVFAFRQPSNRIGVGSLYGLMVFCTSKLEVCYIEANGFYLGKLRGLLGDGNNEPYDDFRLPNGKICTSESEFGNAYRLARSCPQVQAPEHSHHQLHDASLPPACEQVFGGISPLRTLSLFMDMSPFRQACIHAVTGTDAAKDLHEACDLGRGMAALALTGLLPAVLPNVCVKCTDADKPRDIGDSYEFKVPNKQADIILSVETTESNAKTYKDIVVPLVSHLIDSLKSKHITDVKVFLVGHTSKYPYPILYDTDLKLKNAHVHFDDKERYNNIPTIKTGYESFDKYEDQIISIINDLKNTYGFNNIEASKQSLFDLPVRPGAIKHLVFAIGEPCIGRCFLLDAIESAIYDVIFKNMAVTTSLITATPDLKIGGGKNLNQVVGFSEHSVVLLGEKKQTKDSETLRGTLQKTDDSCVNFVEGTGGYVFSSTNFEKLNAPQQKQFIQTAANTITHKLLSEQLSQLCTCTYVDPFRVRSVCVNKDKKDASRRRK
ncbi:apolipophorins isoform X1 [Bombyx mandarina]|uniref:Apolipophorins isoform X1 n=1 Tax=Bombyx mandarina TaxID=7092 RepID=A0A6J2JB90_BOMMA|nr:apolipophorins isoform X1 [Bombyx mandarina]